MILEQRIEALEKAVASLTLPNAESEELAKMMQDTVSEVIRNAEALDKLGRSASTDRQEQAEEKINILQHNIDDLAAKISSLDSSVQAAIAEIQVVISGRLQV